MTNDQQVTRAIDALQVIENPAYKAAMEAMKAEIVAAWKDCPVRDREGQLLFLQLAKLSDKFSGILQGFIEGGKMAQHKIDIDSARNENVIRKWARRAV